LQITENTPDHSNFLSSPPLPSPAKASQSDPEENNFTNNQRKFSETKKEKKTGLDLSSPQRAPWLKRSAEAS
jgi:hypothetical protein